MIQPTKVAVVIFFSPSLFSGKRERFFRCLLYDVVLVRLYLYTIDRSPLSTLMKTNAAIKGDKRPHIVRVPYAGRSTLRPQSAPSFETSHSRRWAQTSNRKKGENEPAVAACVYLRIEWNNFLCVRISIRCPPVFFCLGGLKFNRIHHFALCLACFRKRGAFSHR